MTKILNFFVCMSLMLVMGCGSENDVFLAEEPDNSQELTVGDYDFYVSPDGDDANTGSVVSPFKSVQQAIEALEKSSALKSNSSEPMKIKLADGVYNETLEVKGNGKYVLEGNMANPQNVVVRAARAGSPVMRITAPTAVRGVTITGGNTTGSTGSGIQIEGVSADITHCIITGNTSEYTNDIAACAIHTINGGNFFCI